MKIEARVPYICAQYVQTNFYLIVMQSFRDDSGNTADRSECVSGDFTITTTTNTIVIQLLCLGHALICDNECYNDYDETDNKKRLFQNGKFVCMLMTSGRHE